MGCGNKKLEEVIDSKTQKSHRHLFVHIEKMRGNKFFSPFYIDDRMI